MITALMVATLWLDAGALATDPASSTPGSGTSGAEGADHTPPAPDPSDDLVRLAAEQYGQGLFNEALATLEQAQRLSPKPSIVYNIAQVQRRRGDCAAALTGYTRYLETTPPADAKRGVATRWATEMKACVAQNATALAGAPSTSVEAAASGPAPIPKASGVRVRGTASTLEPAPLHVAPPVPGVDLTASRPANAGHRRARIAGWSMVAAGGLCEVAAIVFESMVWVELSHINSNRFDNQNQSTWRSSGHQYSNWALGTAIAGGALVAGGTITLIVNRQPNPVTPPTTVLAVAGTF